MGEMFDENLMLRKGSTAGNLTGNETTPSIEMGGDRMFEGLDYTVHVPAFVSATTLDVKIQVSDNDSSWLDFLHFPQISAVGSYTVNGATRSPYRRAVLTVGGVSPNFGAVDLGATIGRREWEN
jgi:hypothetical protein